MNAGRRLLLVLVCALGVLIVAATFPAADPRLDAPGESSTGAGDWESVTTASEFTDENDTDREEQEIEEPGLELRPVTDSDLVPGEIATIGVPDDQLLDSDYRSVTMLVDGETVGTAEPEERPTFRVPEGVEEFNVTVAETGDTVWMPVETEIEFATRGAVAPDREIEIRGTIGEYEVGDATVSVDGEAVGTTRSDGSITVELPETAGPIEVEMHRDQLAGNHTYEVHEPEVSFTSQVIFPGMPSHVSVTADGVPIENATVAVGDSETTTSDSGTTWVRLPLSDEVTVTATVGAEEASTTVSNLYLRTTLVVLVGPGLFIGGTWTYLKYAPHRYRRRMNLTGPMLKLGNLLGSLSTILASTVVAGLSAVKTVRLPRLGLSRFRFPRPNLSLVPSGSFSLGFPSLGGLFGSLTSSDSSDNRSLSASIKDAVTREDDAGENTPESTVSDDEEPTRQDDIEKQPAPREELRETWHTFLDHAGIRNRETWTPGEASRYALAAGYPREGVRRLLGLFRDAEYGESEPSAEDVTDARSTVETLTQHDPTEEDSQ